VLHDRRRSGPAESTWIQNSRMGVIVRQAYRKRVALAWEEERLQPYPDLPLTDDFGDERPVSPRIDLKVVSPDGRWSLAKNADDQLTITDQNRNASVLAPPSLVSAHPLAYLDAQRAFLLIRSRWNLRGDVDWQFEIFDPSTSRIKALALVDDDVQWWLSAVSRPRQPVSNSQTLYWGAIPQPRSKTTQFGQFDVAKMRWVRLTWIPGIQFQTRDLLVDEVRKKACVVHEGNVVSFDLPSWEYDRDAHP